MNLTRTRDATDGWQPASNHAIGPASILWLVLFLALLPTALFANASQICDRAATVVSRETNVPLNVLRAITLTETGRNHDGTMRPWPWTVNMEGKGVWFDTEDDARAYVYEHFKRGARSFDVGCFQLNYKWHHQGFSSIDEMFDPLASGRYAAKFLSDLFAEKGDWTLAAGAYHSRTPEYAQRYEAKFAQHLANVANEAAAPVDLTVTADTIRPEALPTAEVVRVRVNSFPLLQANEGDRTPGSLVPLSQSSTRLIDFHGSG